MKKVFAFIAAFLFSVIPLFAERALAVQDSKDITNVVKDVAESSKVVEITDSVKESIRDAIERYAEKKGIIFGKTQHGKFFVYSIQLVNRSPDSPYSGNARIAAFERAWLDAQKQIAAYLSQRIASNTYRKLFRNDSEGAENIELSNWDVIKAKIVGLTDAALNKALKELGVDPSKFGNLTVEKKRNLLFDSIVKEVIRKTYAELAGTVIIQTFEGEKNGNYAVGVVAMYSPKLKLVTKAILNKQIPPFKSKIGHPISYYLPSKPEDYLRTWGVRIVVDENNLPALLSFGQWSYAYTAGNKERKRGYAMEQASMLADSYISEFLNSRVFAEESSKFGENIRTDAIFKNGDTFTETASRIIDIEQKKIKRTSKVRISGIVTVKRKLLRLPSGQEVAVVVKVWTYENMRGAEELKNLKRSKFKSQKHQKSYKSGDFISHGKDMTDINDF